MRLSGTKTSSIHQYRGLGDQLWDLGGARPSLDLQFSANKNLIDSVSGQSLVTFTRASSGTYVGSDRTLKTATTNLLLRSEEFDSGAAWQNQGSTDTANIATAPNGTLTADEVIEDSLTGNHYITQSFTSTTGIVYTFSCYIKAANRAFCFLGANGAGTVQFVSVNLSTGVASSATGSPSNITSVSIGNGWYRVSFTYTSGTTGAVGHEVRLSTDGVWANRSYTGNGTGSVYVWGAQLEQSSTVGEYIPTTSVINSAPRFDHNPTTGESLGLLVEEQRTNLLVQSNGFDTTWTNTNSTETAASGTAPDGTNTAWQLRDTVDASSVAHSLNQTVTFTAATAYTLSVWGKAGTLDRMALVFPSTLFTNATARVLSITFSTGVTSTSGSPTSTTVTQFSNGWWRLSMTATIDNGVAAAISIRAAIASGSSYQGDGNGTILIWGAQLETGAFSTSYIPTTTATATRSADVASITGTNFSSWYRQDEGTVFADADRNTAIAAATTVVSINDNTTNNRLLNLRQDSSSQLTVISQTGGVLDGSTQVSLTNTSARNKVAAAQALNNLAASANGGTAVADALVAMPTVNQMQIGNVTNTSLYNGTIRRLAYWPARLPNSTLQNITQ